ncbi:hypothetical protein [Streptacidiphilus cavernicola]|uniref:Uncharacterized protein n=1 Tax=Streptacidiphilus cavernicola TaxID=3342716 RepID=A0ABV6W4G3_9ACTN
MSGGIARTPLVQPLAQPEETPECESSTCHGISVHDPVYQHDVWWNWVGLLGVAFFTLGAVGFMIGRVVAM